MTKHIKNTKSRLQCVIKKIRKKKKKRNFDFVVRECVAFSNMLLVEGLEVGPMEPTCN